MERAARTSRTRWIAVVAATVAAGAALAAACTPVGQPAPKVAVGPGAAESSVRQAVRTLNGRVYIGAIDDDGNPRNGFTTPSRLHMYRANQTGIPTSFSEADAADAPRTNAPNTMSGPDLRLDAGGVIHLVYYRTDFGIVVYQTFDTTTNQWGASEIVTAWSGIPNAPTYGRRGETLAALSLGPGDVPFVTVSGIGGVKVWARVYGGWYEIATPSTVSSRHASSTFDRIGRLHLTWLEDDDTIRYVRRDVAGTFTAVETVASGNPAVLSNAYADQSPSIAVDELNQPVVIFLSGTPGMSDNLVRVRTRTPGGWVADDPQVFAHTPAVHTVGGYVFALLGHDAEIHPGYHSRNPEDDAWSTFVPFQPAAPQYRYDGSASARYDPLREVDCGVIDVVYFDEDSDARGGFKPDLYYAAIKLDGARSGTGSCREILA